MFSQEKFELDLAGYEEFDPYWKAVADFLRTRLTPEARLIGPQEMAACFPSQGSAYETTPTGEYDWLVLHKDMLSDAAMRGWD